MFVPTEDRIAGQLIDDSEQNGLKVVRHDNREDLVRVKVLAVGPDCHSVKANHTILVPRWAIHEIEVDAKPLSLTREAEVLAIIN